MVGDWGSCVGQTVIMEIHRIIFTLESGLSRSLFVIEGADADLKLGAQRLAQSTGKIFMVLPILCCASQMRGHNTKLDSSLKLGGTHRTEGDTVENTETVKTRIWHVPAKHANRMDARAHTSTLAECAPRFMTRGIHGFVGQSSPNLAHV